MKKILLFVVNQPAFFLSHRLPLALAAKKAGYKVHVATQPGPGVEEIETAGLLHHKIPLHRSARNPFVDLWLLCALIRLFIQLRPTVVHLVTIKPVIFGGLAARIAGVKGVVFAISGLGFAFKRNGVLSNLLFHLIRVMYRLALSSPNKRVIFQNPTDQELVSDFAKLSGDQSVLVPGSGVDLSQYQYDPEPTGTVVATMACRLLKDKGAFEFVAAAKILKDRGIEVIFRLAGVPDPDNLTSCTLDDLDRWRTDGCVELLGYRSDIPQLFAASHIVVLPSWYFEGLPKVLIEAAACGRAVVTTVMPGCRDAIQPNVTGILVPAKDALSLANAIHRLAIDADMRQAMGAAGRVWAEKQFDIQSVISKHLEIYETLSRPPGSGDLSTRQ
jgi:glycosyltransferase involved in cell wall biosynthesis